MSKLRKSAELAFAVLIAVCASAGAALAEGNGDPFGLENSELRVGAAPLQDQSGAVAYPSYSLGASIPVIIGGVTPANASNAEPEPLNSLPSAPEIGGVWTAQQEHELR